MSDQEIIKLILMGNHDAMRELIVKYQDLVVNTCYQVLHNREDAEDIAQDVFIKAYQSMPSLRKVNSLSFWLYRISLNKSINYLNKNRFFKKFLKFDELLDCDRILLDSKYTESSNHHLEKKEKLKIIQYALDKLPSKQKKAFILHYYEGLTYSEIAEVLEVSVSAVESLIFRAKTRIIKICQEIYNKGYEQ
jgi:RNA polymerase sigma-70 factor (ECF subfamily)